MPLKLLALMIGNDNIERKSSIIFLGVLMGKHVSWVDHVRIVEFEIAKNIGLLHHISQYLSENSFKTVFLVYLFLFELCKYCTGENISNKIEKSLSKTKTSSADGI